MDYFLKGTLDNYIDRLCATMKYVDKEWAGKIRPATTEQIERLCNLAGMKGKPLKLPKTYMAYLKKLGQDDGGLLEWEWDHCTEVIIDVICKRYDNYAVYAPDFDLSRYLLIATHWMESELFLDITGGDNPPVYYNANELYAASFEKYTFQMAFDIMLRKRYLYCDSISLSLRMTQALLDRPDEDKENFGGTIQERLACAMKLLERYSLQPAWFSDEVRCCCFGEKMAVKVEVSFAILIVIGSDDEILIQKMKEELEKEINQK